MDFIKQQIIDYLSKRKIITLATSSVDGIPFIHPVAYVNKGPILYFSTNRDTRKVHNIKENPNVACTVFDSTEFLDEIRSIQIEGKASIVVDKAESNEVLKLLCKKFPSMENMTENPNLTIIKINPKIAYFSDYIKRFGHREIVKY